MGETYGDEGGVDFRNIVGMDPASQWVLGEGLEFFAPPGERDPWVPFILFFEDQAAASSIGLLWSPASPPQTPGIVIRHPVAITEGFLKPGVFYSALAPRTLLYEIAKAANEPSSPYHPFAASAKRIKLSLPLPIAYTIQATAQSTQQAAAAYPDSTVVVGIIDDAIAFANARFRRSNDKTRFAAFWSQDPHPTGTPPAPFLYGNELSGASIDALIAPNMYDGWLDEDEVYRGAGIGDFTTGLHKGVAWRIAHGTHVADLASGFDMADDRADRPIIGVQLPVAITAAQSGPGLEYYVMDAIKYILDQAAAIRTPDGKLAPVVINFSYATHDGPHDGTSLLEMFVDSMVTPGEASSTAGARQVVLPAGNTVQSRCHAEIAFRNSNEAELWLRVQPDCTEITTLQLWLPCRGPAVTTAVPPPSRVSLTIEGPAGTITGTVTETPLSQVSLIQNGVPCGLATYVEGAGTAGRGLFRIDINPTASSPDLPTDGGVALAPSGVWTITLRNVSLAPQERIQGWINRDDLLYGYPRRGRQAYFDDDRYDRFDAKGAPIVDDPPLAQGPVLRNSMINALGAGRDAVVIGAYRRKDLMTAAYSAGGPTGTACDAWPDEGTKPDALAASDGSRVFSGIFAAGTKSGSVVTLSGTSMACARVTRWCADQLAKGIFPSRAEVAALAVAGEAALPGAPSLPAARSGAGRIVSPDPEPPHRVRYDPP